MSYDTMRYLLEVEKEGKGYFKELSQQVLTRDFLYAPNVYTARVQIGYSNEYEEKQVRVSNAIEKNNLQLLTYDKETYKTVMFDDIDYNTRLGMYIKMKDKSPVEYTWMAVMSDSEFSIYNSIVVQRCNEKVYTLGMNNDLQEVWGCESDRTQQGSGLTNGSEATYLGALESWIVPVNDVTLKYYIGQRMLLQGRHFKVVKIDHQNTLLAYNIPEGLLIVKLVENFSDLNRDDTMLDDRYKFHDKPDIQVSCEKLLNYKLNEVFELPINIIKNGQPYSGLKITYDLLNSPNITQDLNTFKITKYGMNTLRVHLSETDYDEILDIKINCIDDSVIIPTYKINNKHQQHDNFSIRKIVTKVYVCDKFIGDNKINGDYEITYTTDNVDLTKVEIDNSIKDEISIYNKSSIQGSITISFKDISNNTITTQIITLTK